MNFHDFPTQLPIAAQLGEAGIQAIAPELEILKIPAGKVVFKQGDAGDSLYIIKSGKLRAAVTLDAKTGTYLSDSGAGEIVGEMSLFTGQARTATVHALEDSELLRLPKAAFDRLIEDKPELITALADRLLPRFQRDQTRMVLKQVFGGMDDSLLRQMLGQMDCAHLDSGQTLFRQGEPGDAMYIIIQGRVRFVKEISQVEQRVLGEAGTGEILGEFALLSQPDTTDSLRTATAYATRATDLLVITRPVFDNLICQYPDALLNLTRQIVQRAVHRDKPVTMRESNIAVAVLPVHVGQVLDEFSNQLSRALSSFGSTILLTPQRFDDLYGKPGVSQTPLDHPLNLVINVWLDERENENRYTLYQVDPVLDEAGQLTPWTRRCIEDADILLFVGEADTNPAMGEFEAALETLRLRSRKELVLLHPFNRDVSTWAPAWLGQRESSGHRVDSHHHVRLGNQSDFRRLARRLIGKPIGLTLAGGGARGWAHVGVLRAMEEAQMEYDWVAGASMGAIVAAGCALDWTSERITGLASMFSNPKKLLDYTLPYASITSTRYITGLFQELFAGANIEDTWHPFFCVSANLSAGAERLHTRGPLWKAVRASMAFPGIFAPILEEGAVLIDGGAANNLPVDHMRRMCPQGTVIGVNLVEASPVSGEYVFGPSLSGWEVLRGRILPATTVVKAPTLLDIISGVVYSNNCYRLNETGHFADVLIKVPVHQYGLLDFDKYNEIIDLGYHTALDYFEKYHQ
jgi:predicted acylesterase/phospholipase RssA/CRP-like cAMP-binding protein